MVEYAQGSSDWPTMVGMTVASSHRRAAGTVAPRVTGVEPGEAPDLDARTAWVCVATLFMDPSQAGTFPQVAADLGLNPGALKCLFTIQSRGSVAMSELATAWNCDASMVTQLVDTLEREGYAKRVASPIDRRRRLVGLTKAGIKAHAKALDRLGEPPQALEALSAKEQATLAKLLLKALSLADPPIAIPDRP